MNTSIVFLGDPLVGQLFSRGYLETLLGKIIPNPSPNNNFMSGTFSRELLADYPPSLGTMSLIRQLHVWGAKLRQQGIGFECYGPEWEEAHPDPTTPVEYEIHPFWQNNLDMSMEGNIVLLFVINRSKALNGPGILQNLRLREKRGIPVYAYLLNPDYNTSSEPVAPLRVSLDRLLVIGDGRAHYTT